MNAIRRWLAAHAIFCIQVAAVAGLMLAIATSRAADVTIQFQGTFPIVVCQNATYTNQTATQTLVIACPDGRKLTYHPCPKPKLTTLSPGNYQLTCS